MVFTRTLESYYRKKRISYKTKKISKVTRKQSFQDVKRSKADNFSVMRRKELKRSTIRTGSRKGNVNKRKKWAKAVGSPLLPEL